MRHKFSVAPMMEWTDRHCRMLHRLLTRETLLYTEMVTADAVIHGDRARLIGFDPREHPVALQLGGSDPARLTEAAKIGAEFGYDEINLNVGCPSDRVQNGMIGACLMKQPLLLADCISAMQDADDIPVSLKCRVGVDDMDSDDALEDFVATLAQTGLRTFIIHARIAILQGLSPRENREIPPLNYARVFGIKRSFPDLEIVINGGIRSLDQAEELLTGVDGVMVGREAYQNPYLLSEVDRRFFGSNDVPPSRQDIIRDLLPYVEREISRGVALKHITRHVLGLFQGLPGARKWRRCLCRRWWRR